MPADLFPMQAGDPIECRGTTFLQAEGEVVSFRDLSQESPDILGENLGFRLVHVPADEVGV
jgi:hypothetical protein